MSPLIPSQRGYHGTSIAAVSRLSGLPASSIYWHFKNKDDLIAAVIQRSFDSWSHTATQVSLRRPGVAPREHLVSSTRSQAAALVADPEFLRLGLMLALERHPQEPSAAMAIVAIHRQPARAGAVQHGAWRPVPTGRAPLWVTDALVLSPERSFH